MDWTIYTVYYTGSFRKNGKVIFCENLNFHDILVFSAVLGPELSANLSPSASRFNRTNPRHPKKLAPSMCFQSLVGCLKPTTAVVHCLGDFDQRPPS